MARPNKRRDSRLESGKYEHVLISLEKGALTKADRYAKTHKMTRSELIAKALAQVVNAAG